MAATYDRQYRPIGTQEALGDSGADVRSLLDLADSINNYFAHAGHFKLCSRLFMPELSCWPAGLGEHTSSEYVILHVGQYYWTPPYTIARWWINGAKTDATAGKTTWRLYFSKNLYRGPEVFDSSYLDESYSGSLEISSDTRVPATSTIGIPVGYMYRAMYCLLTAQTDVAVTSKLCSLDIQPGMGVP